MTLEYLLSLNQKTELTGYEKYYLHTPLWKIMTGKRGTKFESADDMANYIKYGS